MIDMGGRILTPASEDNLLKSMRTESNKAAVSCQNFSLLLWTMEEASVRRTSFIATFTKLKRNQIIKMGSGRRRKKKSWGGFFAFSLVVGVGRFIAHHLIIHLILKLCSLYSQCKEASQEG
jgi:hypothetical protein